jgi:precorrin-2 dehydrogenase/sirohydrochlorin ferrochelatase
MFVEMKNKNCIVIGGGNVAARKIETLLEFDASITVISPEVEDRIKEISNEGRVIIKKKKYSQEDLEGAFLVIAATSDKEVNERIFKDANERNMHVNVIDDPVNCTFLFPSIVKRGDLVVGISTSGGFPSLSKCIKGKIEEVIPENYCELLKILKECRTRAIAEVHPPMRRKELLGKILEEALYFDDSLNKSELEQRIENIFGEYKKGQK